MLSGPEALSGAMPFRMLRMSAVVTSWLNESSGGYLYPSLPARSAFTGGGKKWPASTLALGSFEFWCLPSLSFTGGN
jgi:hypothetical protein